MAEVVAQLSGVRKESIARVTFFTDANLPPDEWRVVWHFETAEYDDKDVLVPGSQRFGSRRVERAYGVIKNDTIANGVSGTGVAGLLSAGGYKYRAEDIAKENEDA